ncbi:MAG: integrase core domain-containing protein [Pirellulales bacterium]
MSGIEIIFLLCRAVCLSPAALVAENAALRQQLAVYKRESLRPKLRRRDRIFWVWLSQLWSDWRSALVIVQPETVVHWHRAGFRLYWRLKSRKSGRPKASAEVRQLIRRIARENPLWGAPRIQSELKLLGHELAESTVAKYLPLNKKPPSATWKTFLSNHLCETTAIDFFVVPTATFRVLYVFVMLSLDRRRVVHFNVTANPTAQWTAQQITEAFPFDDVPRFLQRDRDSINGEVFQRRVQNLGIEEVVSAPRSPWQNPYVERLIGSIRRECLNHVIVLNERHLMRILAAYFDYYHRSRTHLSLDGNAPHPRDVEPPDRGKVIAVPQVGGLHHRYTRVAA